jgi:membrane fusion protein (multidrug efflux system)
MPNSPLIDRSAAKRPSLAKRLILTVVAVLLLIAAIVGVKVLTIQKMMASFKPPPPAVVSTAKVVAQDWSDRIETVGSVRALRGTDLSAEVAGIVRSVKFHSGQNVAAGQVLFELNADAERAQLQSLQAAADLAKIVLDRDRAQLAVSAVSQATIDSDESDLKNKQAQVDQQKAVVEKKLIRAPFAGRTGITTVNPGQYLNPGDKVVTLQSIDNLYVDFNVPQRQLARVSLGSAVDIAFDAYPQKPFTGKVTSFSPLLDTATRNVSVEATMKNDKHEVLPGMFARVALYVGTTQHFLTVPQAAIAYNPYGATVFVLEEAKDSKDGKDAQGGGGLKARQSFVTTGATRGDQVAILKGLKEGDVIVTSGQLKLKNGSPVTVDNSMPPPDDAHPTPQEH